MLRIIFLPTFFFLTLFHAESGFAQRIEIKTGQEPICIYSKRGSANYFLEDGVVEYQGKAIAKTKRGCFTPPATLCNNSKKIQLTFKPYSLYKYFKKTIPIFLTGVKRSQYKSPNLRCVPVGASRYPNENVVAKIPNFNQLQKLKLSIPYVANVRVKDSGLLRQIRPFVKDCPKGDQTCLIYNAYKQVTTTLNYKADPYTSGGDLIRSPQETINNRGGDCEDLTGVLVSYLVNLGIRSYVVMTDDHAYSMACGVNKDQLEELIKKSFDVSETQSERFNLGVGQFRSFSFSKSRAPKKSAFRWKVQSRSEYPFNLFVVNKNFRLTQQNIQRIPFKKNCSKKDITFYTIPCVLSINDQIILSYGDSKAPGGRNKSVVLDIVVEDNLLESIRDFSIHYYVIKKLGADKFCVVLEATAGQNGYPGFSDRKNKGIPIAIDPVSWDWFFIR